MHQKQPKLVSELFWNLPNGSIKKNFFLQVEPENVHVLLSEDKIEEYREVFSFFDRDGGGTITSVELGFVRIFKLAKIIQFQILASLDRAPWSSG